MSLWAALAAGRDHACADTIGQRLLSETAPKDRSWPIVPGRERPLPPRDRAAAGRSRAYSVRIWTPPHFASTPFSGDEVRLLTYIRPLSDLDQPRSGHDGLFARRLLIAISGFAPMDTCRLFRRRFDLFAILRGARNRGDVLLDQSGRTGSGSHMLRFIVGSVAQHRPGDPRHLVGEGGRRHVRVRSLGQGQHPAA